MFLFTSFVLLMALLLVGVFTVIGIAAGSIILVFGDVIVFVILIVLIIKHAMKKGKKNRKAKKAKKIKS